MTTPPNTAPRALPDDTMIVTLRVSDLRAMMREATTAAVQEVLEPKRHRWVSVEAAATHAGVSTKTIRRWIEDGMPSTHLGRDYRMRLPELDAWLEQHPAKARRRK